MVRPEATGYGAVYFAVEMMKTKHEEFKGKLVAISGSGNVAQYACEKVNHLGGKVITMSDSDGVIYDKDGIDEKKLQFVLDLKNVKRGRISEYIKQYPNAKYFDKLRPWEVVEKCDVAIPCATQNEVSEMNAMQLIKAGIKVVVEGANMPCEPKAVKLFQQNKILFSPGKASNAGGVATSGLEMSQNSQRLNWTRHEVDEKLQKIMQSIHE